VLLSACDSDTEVTFCWEGVDPDGQVVGYQHLLIHVDEEYYETGGASGGWLDADESEADELWTPRDERTSITYRLEPGSYLFRVRAVDDEGNPDPTHAETLWQKDPYKPSVTIVSGCTPLYYEPSPLIMTCDAHDVGVDRRPTPRTELEYSYSLDPTFGEDGCPVYRTGQSEWTPFPDETTPLELVFEDLELAVPRSRELRCEWHFSFAVRDAAGNIAMAGCWFMILQ
jgi:hypothetical protein